LKFDDGVIQMYAFDQNLTS